MMHPKSAALALLLGLAITRAAFGDATPTADDRKAASIAFRDADRAYRAGDYRHAAEAYHEAYVRAPHYAPLWNEARAWEKASEVERAANVYAKYLREAPANAPDRNRATAALDRLAKKLARLDIHAASGLVDVKVDGAAIEDVSVYVVPGAHVVEARDGDAVVRQSPSVEAGSITSVALLAAPKPSNAAVATLPPAPAPSRTWSPVVVYFGGAVTAITAGLAIWSGFDTLSQKTTFNAAPTQDNLDSGRSKESRTNVIVGASAGVGVFTLAAAVFLVDWHATSSGEKQPSDQPGGDPGTVTVGLGVGSFVVRGAF
jgi:hypothetical protein